MTLATEGQRSPIAPLYRWSIERYHQAVEAGIFDEQPVELLDGQLIAMVPEGIAHAGLSSDGADYLRERLGDRAKVREGKPITLPNDSEPEPDIAIVQPLSDRYKTERHPHVSDIFWVIEYANTNLEKDMQLKTQIYAATKIPEYWVINLRSRELIVFREPAGDTYQSRQTMTDGTICPVSFPTIAIEVAKLVA